MNANHRQRSHSWPAVPRSLPQGDAANDPRRDRTLPRFWHDPRHWPGVRQTLGEDEAHWNEEAKALLGGLILFIAAEEEPHRRHLGTLREHLTLAPDAFLQLLTRMQRSRAALGLVARAADRHLGKSDREASGVLSSAQRHTHFLDSPRMPAVLERSDFHFADLRTATTTVFLVLPPPLATPPSCACRGPWPAPPDRLSTYARWLRLMVGEGLADLVRSGASKAGTPPSLASANPVRFLLDEFAALGPL